jgi:hypothetical protein
MLEHRRQHYLSLLGIENYVPTRLLTGAASSVLLPDELLIDPALLSASFIQSRPVIDDDNKSADDSAKSGAHIAAASTVDEIPITNAVAIDRSVASPESPRALLEKEFLAQSTQQPKQKALADTDDQTTENHKQIDDRVGADQPANHADLAPIKFVFSVWRVKDILILDTRKVREALPTDHLLQNILRSVGYAVAQLPASDSWRWPFDNKNFYNKKFNNKVPTTEQVSLSAEQYKNEFEQASASAQAFVTGHHENSPLKYLFLMGEEASKFTLGDSIDFESSNGSILQANLWQDIQCLIMPSLYSMLQEPSTKGIAWKALRLINTNAD